MPHQSEYHLVTFFGGETGWNFGDEIRVRGKFIGFPSVRSIVKFIIKNKDNLTADPFDTLFDISGYETEGSPSDYTDDQLYNRFMKRLGEPLDGFNAMLVSAREKFYSRMLFEEQISDSDIIFKFDLTLR